MMMIRSVSATTVVLLLLLVSSFNVVMVNGGGNLIGDMMGLTDDGVLSDLGDIGNLISTTFGQCLNNNNTTIDIEKLMQDPFGDVKNRCTEEEAATFNSALDTFQRRAGFDLKKLIEELGSVFIGIVMNCGSYWLEAGEVLNDMLFSKSLEDLDKIKARESPLPRVPQECVDALVGDNPFGTAFLYAEKVPKREQKIFLQLSERIPMCTLNEWPVPIVGSWLSALSCIYGNSQDYMYRFLQNAMAELQLLNECIPGHFSTLDCKEIRNKCIFDNNKMPAMSMVFPPPFWNPPMAEPCQELSELNPDKDFGDVLNRYEIFRQTCIPAADLAIWDIAASHKEKNKGLKGGLTWYMSDTTSIDEKNDEEDTEEAEVDILEEVVGLGAEAPPATASSSASGSTKFMPGLLTGIIVVFAGMFGYKRYRNRRGYMPFENTGYEFSSLELSEGPMFS